MTTTTTLKRMDQHSSQFANLSLAHPTQRDSFAAAKPLPHRPQTSPRSTEPSPSALLHGHQVNRQGGPIARPLSPYSQYHARSHSAAGVSATEMSRARSAPGSDSHIRRPYSPARSPARSSSPLRSPSATRPTFRKFSEDLFPSGLVSFSEIESISEDSELHLTPRTVPDRDSQVSPFTAASIAGSSNSYFRPRRSSPSPMHSAYSTPLPSTVAGSLPPFYPSRNDERVSSSGGSFQSMTSSLSANSSLVSTPTSFRSRSPSISSLETIPDSPDAEEAALEAEAMAKMRAAAELADADDAVDGIRRSLDVSGSRGSWGSKDKRKRWSVCGAERRGDFEMETIWED